MLQQYLEQKVSYTEQRGSLFTVRHIHCVTSLFLYLNLK